MHDSVNKYRDLIRLFLSGAVNATAFETLYLSIFASEPLGLAEDVYEVLNGLFLDVDAFCPDPLLRDEQEDDIDEETLRQRCKLALCKLDRMASGP